MVPRTFDKRLLEFIYRLTLYQKLMNSREMAQNITIQGKKVSERTIKRWLKHLRENHYFTYYPHIITEKLGLVKVVVFTSGLKNRKLLDVIPYKTYLMFGTALGTLKDTFMVHYLIPKEHLYEFENYWRKVLALNLTDNYEILKLRCSNALYAPVHQSVRDDGRVDWSKSISNYPEMNVPDNKIFNVQICDEIKANPFLVPILIEYYKAWPSSKKVWFSMKQKLSEGVWDYVRDVKIKKRKSDGQGIRFVSNTLNYLHSNFNTFFKQIRVSYGPLYKSDNISFGAVLTVENKSEIKELLKPLLKYSLFMAYNESLARGKNLFLEVTTDMFGMTEIFNMLSNLRNVKRVRKLVLFNYAKSSEYWETKTTGWLKQHYHELFSPKTVSWIYDSEKYLTELKLLPAIG